MSTTMVLEGGADELDVSEIRNHAKVSMWRDRRWCSTFIFIYAHNTILDLSLHGQGFIGLFGE